MPIRIDRSSGIPLYIQLKDQLAQAIKRGEHQPGERMPTERVLAEELNISRKTVSRAYNMLEAEGILASHQGSGTYVASDVQLVTGHSEKEAVIKAIDEAISAAFESNITMAEFLTMTRRRVREKEAVLYQIKAVFVECNIEQARSFADEMSKYTDFKLVPVTVKELDAMSDRTRSLIDHAKVIIPAFNHVNEVREILKRYHIKKKVMGVAINPDLGVIVRIAKYPENTRFGLISLSKEFHTKVDYALKSAGLSEINLKMTTAHDRLELEEFLQDVDVVIVSPGRKTEIEGVAGQKKDIIRFDYTLDSGSVKAILSGLDE